MFLASQGLGSMHYIIIASLVLIISFFFGELSKKTSVPSVLMLIILGIIGSVTIRSFSPGFDFDIFNDPLELLGTVGLIMIVLEAALELKLDKDKVGPITKAFFIALIGLLASTWLTALVLHKFYPEMTTLQTWIYATPLSILSSAIIIPSVLDLRHDKKEFHIYESTFSDILGIMLFFYLKAQTSDSVGGIGSMASYLLETVVLIVVSFIVSYVLLVIFQNIKSSVKLFLLIAVLLLLYAVGKLMGQSSLIVILVFGLIIANMKLFFAGPLKQFLNKDAAHDIYHGLHVVTMETAFVVRTFFFVIFGITIQFGDLLSMRVAGISLILLAIIYVVRVIILGVGVGKDMVPQLFIAPRGLITVLLFTQIPAAMVFDQFGEGILLYIIIFTSIIMTIAMIWDKRRANAAIRGAESIPVNEVKWRLPQG